LKDGFDSQAVSDQKTLKVGIHSFPSQVKIGRSSAKDGASERLRCGTIQKEVSWILQRVSAGAA